MRILIDSKPPANRTTSFSGLAWLGLLAVALCGCGSRSDPAPSKDPDAKEKPSAKAGTEADAPELKWAHEIARDFLDQVAAGKFEKAAQLVILVRRHANPDGLRANHLSDILGGRSGQAKGFRAGDEFTSWDITFKILSPAKDEAKFRGSMQGPKRTATFALQVQKDTDSKWRVGDFTAVTKAK
jgi:hypothetical protein